MSGPFDVGDLSPKRYFAVVAVTLGLLFAFIAGGDDDGLSPLVSLVQWQLQTCIPMALLLLVHQLCLRTRPFRQLGPWPQLFLSGLIGSSLAAGPALLIDYFLGIQGTSTLGWDDLLDEWAAVTPPVTLAWMAMNAPFALGFRLRAGSAGVPQVAPLVSEAPQPPTFMTLLPPAAQGRLLYLQAELHYLAVVTEQGRSLILYNLRDAVDELGDLAGFQSHRSYWVVTSAVVELKRRGRQGVLLMENDDEVPVSRRRIGEVRGLLA